MLAPRMYDFKSLAKRLLESPSYEESGRVLNTFCIGATPTTTVDENPMTTDAVNKHIQIELGKKYVGTKKR